jgi:hypothetical protein
VLLAFLQRTLRSSETTALRQCGFAGKAKCPDLLKIPRIFGFADRQDGSPFLPIVTTMMS